VPRINADGFKRVLQPFIGESYIYSLFLAYEDTYYIIHHILVLIEPAMNLKKLFLKLPAILKTVRTFPMTFKFWLIFNAYS
jgi:hypothetical protein